MKQILGVHGKTPNLAIHAELGLEPLCFKAFKLMFKYVVLQISPKKDNFESVTVCLPQMLILVNHIHNPHMSALF
jgi:hypothetical protein